jgi:hypothetical protein
MRNVILSDLFPSLFVRKRFHSLPVWPHCSYQKGFEVFDTVYRVAQPDLGHFCQLAKPGFVFLPLKNFSEPEPRESFPFRFSVVVVVIPQTVTEPTLRDDSNVKHAVVAVKDVDAGLFTEIRQSQTGLSSILTTDKAEIVPLARVPLHFFTTPEKPIVLDGHRAKPLHALRAVKE